MTREQAKEYILEHATEYLKPDGSGKGYICPVCGSGGGRHGTGLQLGANKRTFTCFAGACINGTSGGDIFDVIGAEYGLTDYNDKLMKAAELFRITVDGAHDQTGATGAAAGMPPTKRKSLTAAPVCGIM